ncbi:MAG: 3-deoxy-manno-octulosonate cytidylyltransferase [Asgard group archaeon]|nr:3-deoxy-manno-octulosonate cytidylyltransferase [Asgard group archaeon]
MKVGFLITARLKSTRLPMKIILKIHEREMIKHMIDRLKISDAIDVIILCTSPNPQDKPLIDIAKEEGIEYFLGHEEDVIQRLTDAANHFKLDFVINVSADNPLVSLEYIKKMREVFEETNADHITGLDLPIGLYPYGLNPKAMRIVCERKKSEQTEVWGRYFTETGEFKVIALDIPEKHKRNYRLTLDYQEDFEFFKVVYDHFGKDAHKVTINELIQFLDEHPEVVKLNANCQKLYEERWKKQRDLAK